MKISWMKCWDCFKGLFSKKESSQKQKNSGNVYSFFGTADANVNMPNINAKDSTIIINTYHQSASTTHSKEKEPVKNPSVDLDFTTRVNPASNVNIKKFSVDQLSERELQIMMMIASKKSTQAIAEELSVSGTIVNGYRYRIFEKLDLKSDAELRLFEVYHSLLYSKEVKSGRRQNIL